MTTPMDRPVLRNSLGSEDWFTPRYAYDANGDTEYMGKAEAGTQDGEPKWLIKKLVYDGSRQHIATIFANGKAAFDQIWNNRESLPYL
ncbi:MAG TPA: hypothetical protein DCS88_10430 [Alphaproteobacteria bacterium]|nr:hypothetical protein [Alphaproteobacteria bacterium]